MDLMPVSDQSKDQQYKGNQKQPRSFRGVHRMAMVTMLALVVGQWSGHADIVDGGRSWVLGVRSWVLMALARGR
jgi:hypothetical protein